MQCYCFFSLKSIYWDFEEKLLPETSTILKLIDLIFGLSNAISSGISGRSRAGANRLEHNSGSSLQIETKLTGRPIKS